MLGWANVSIIPPFLFPLPPRPMNRDRYEEAREELGLGEVPGDFAPEIDARRHDRDPEVDKSDPDSELPLWLPAWITIPLLLTLPFALMGRLPTAVMEVLRYGEVLSISPEEVGR